MATTTTAGSSAGTLQSFPQERLRHPGRPPSAARRRVRPLLDDRRSGACGRNFALERAIELGRGARHGRCVVLEALRCDYRWASDRLHRFVLEGMADNARRVAGQRRALLPLRRAGARRRQGAAGGARRSAPAWSSPTTSLLLPAAHGRRGRAPAPVPLEAVDGNGLLPLRADRRGLPRRPTRSAASCRRAAAHIWPRSRRLTPLAGSRSRASTKLPGRRSCRRWPPAPPRAAAGAPAALARTADRSPVAPAAAARRQRGRRASAATLPRRAALPLRRGPQPARRRRRQRPLALPALRPPLGAPGVRTPSPSARGGRRTDLAGRARPARARAGGGCRAPRRGVPRPAGDLARGRLQLLPPPRRLRPLRVAARRGRSATLGEARRRPAVAASTTLDELAAAATHDPLWNAAQRQLRRRGADPQLPAHAVGQEDPRVVADAAGGARER